MKNQSKGFDGLERFFADLRFKAGDDIVPAEVEEVSIAVSNSETYPARVPDEQRDRLNARVKKLLASRTDGNAD